MAPSTKSKASTVPTDSKKESLVAEKSILASGEVKCYLIEYIKPDPDQPRKFVDQMNYRN